MRITTAVIVLAAFSLLFVPFYRAHGNCQAINTGRHEGNSRARIQKDFILDAAKARQQAADRETGLAASQDAATAKKYRRDAAKIHILLIRSCTLF